MNLRFIPLFDRQLNAEPHCSVFRRLKMYECKKRLKYPDELCEFQKAFIGSLILNTMAQISLYMCFIDHHSFALCSSPLLASWPFRTKVSCVQLYRKESKRGQ